MENASILNFDSRGDNRGKLIALEASNNIPFDIKRVYYIFDTVQDVRRGKHAHLDLEQVLLCVSGECKILLDNGDEKETFLLNSPDKGLYIKGLIWREMYDFSPDAVLLVLASDFYDEADYIRNYDEFINATDKAKKS